MTIVINHGHIDMKVEDAANDRRSVSASEFKAKCLKLIDEVAESGKPLTITKHGRAVASLTPLVQPDRTPLFGALKGSVLESTDVISPIDEDWEANS